MNKLITYLRNSNISALRSFGEKLYVSYNMETNADNFVSLPLKNNDIRSILMEMKLLTSGRYCGNYNYLLQRMNYLIEIGFKSINESNPKTIKRKKVSVNSIKLTDLRINNAMKMLRRDKNGRFISKNKRKR